MKRLTYIIMAVCCIALYSCGMTEPWKDWENENAMDENRLRPSEVKKLLCKTDVWKMSYEGVTFFFQFDEEGNVTSASDEKILENSVKTNYQLEFQGADIVLLTMIRGGMMQYLPENNETVFVITGYSDTQITATGEKYGKTMTLVASTATELQQAQNKKTEAIIAKNKAEAIEKLKQELSNGELRDANDNFMAHYSISCIDNAWKVKISYLDDKTLKHEEHDMTLSTPDDVKAVLNVSGLTVNDEAVNAIYFDYSTSSLSTDNSAVKVTLNNNTDIANKYNTAWSTHVVDRNFICDKFAEMPAQVEFDDRSIDNRERSIVVCAEQKDGAYLWYYVMFRVKGATSDKGSGRIFFAEDGYYFLLGSQSSDPDDAGVVRAVPAFDNFLNFVYNQNGMWMFEDGEWLYALSPEGDEWFRMK